LERRLSRELSTLLEAARELASTHDLDPLLALLLDRLKAVVDYASAAILILDGAELRYGYRRWPPAYEREGTRSIRFPLDRFGAFWERLCRDEPIIIADVRDDSPEGRGFQEVVGGREVAASTFEFIRSCVFAPLVVKGKIIGVLSITRSRPHAFAPREAELAVAIARQAAVAIENARLYEQVRNLAVVEERQRLARELHDSVTQALYGVTLYAEAAIRQLAAGDVETAREHLRDVRLTAKEALGEMRLLLFELRPPLLEEHGLPAALRARLAGVEARSGLATEARIDESVRLSAAVEQDLYRIAQEALNNVLKHARASRVRVELEAVDGRARLEVADDGVGFDPARQDGGLGLAGIRERVGHIGATLRVVTAPRAGTRIVVEVPA
jgi:signal transduction histidine kinase